MRRRNLAKLGGKEAGLIIEILRESNGIKSSMTAGERHQLKKGWRGV